MCLVDAIDVISLVVAGISLVVAGFSLIVASKTLTVTKVTLKWSMDDRQDQNEKEFENFIYKNLKDISSYCTDILLMNEKGEFFKVETMEEAEKNIICGFHYLRIYAITHKLKFLKEFCDVKGDDKSFAKLFFQVNEKYKKYRIDMTDEENNETTKQYLNKFYNLFLNQLHFAVKYANKVLNRPKTEEKTENDKELNQYYEELAKLRSYGKENNLYETGKSN